MKVLLVALLVFVLVSQGAALRCNCGGMRRCRRSIETCTGDRDTCISAIFNPPSSGFFRGCFTKSACILLAQVATVSCCDRDLCNR